MLAPIPSPIGIIDISTPSVNILIPTRSKTAPNKNRIIDVAGNGTNVTARSTTITTIGVTAETDSPIFSLNDLKNNASLCFTFPRLLVFFRIDYSIY